MAWVTQEMKAEKWSAIREIGVEWDAAVVMTTLRESPQSTPASDVETVWSVSLAKHEVHPLLHGVKLRILDWTSFAGAMMPELGLTYDDCQMCAASTYFTTLHYSYPDHGWRARWMRGEQAAAISSSGAVDGVTRTQLNALLTAPEGRDVLATWSHFDYGKVKPAEDYVFEYSVDPSSGLEQTQGLSGKHADEAMARICQAGGSADSDTPMDALHAALTRGQDSELCRGMKAARPGAKSSRRPVTTPPANNHGQSEPPGKRAKAAKPETAKPDASKTGTAKPVAPKS